jgi:hypothetical protein
VRFHDVVGRRIVAIEQDAGTTNLWSIFLDDGAVVEFRAEEAEPDRPVVLSRVVKDGGSALQNLLDRFEWKWATHPAGFGGEWLPVSRDVAIGLMCAAGLDRPLPRPGKEVVLHKVDRNDDWPTVVLVNVGGKFEVRRF